MLKKSLDKLIIKPTRRLLRCVGILPPASAKHDIFKEWPWMSEEPFGDLPAVRNVTKGSLTWFIPPVGRGSGGHLNIFRFVRMLEEQGFDCRIVICHETRRISATSARREITDWFFPLKATIYMHPESCPPETEFAIATGWQTAYVVKAFRTCFQRLYFVQDFEPWFYEAGSLAAFAEATYRFGFTAITAGDWLATLLRNNYGMRTFPVGFGVDHELYRPHPRNPNLKGRHVLFYARPPTKRRGFELGILALQLLTEQLPDVTVHFVGWPMNHYRIPFHHVDHGILPLERLPELYSQCDVALVFSFSNVSLLPLEIMACGCPVVSNGGPNVEWLLNTEVASLVPTDADAIANKLVDVLTNTDLHHYLTNQGISAAMNRQWQREGEHMAEILQSFSPLMEPKKPCIE